jgi:predicted kinase
VQAFEDIAEEFGRDVKQMGGGYNHLSIDGVVATKNISGVYKSGIGIAANINKFVALASQFGLELNSENVIWQFQIAVEKGKTETGDTEYDLTLRKYTNFGTLSEENQRVIASIGNILGMFADGMKKPIPSALGMNEENVGTTLVMIGLGLSPTFAVGFNFLPEVKNAVEAVQATKYAISSSDVNSSKFLHQEVKNQIAKLVKENPGVLEELKNAGVVSPLSKSYDIALKKENIALSFKAQKLDAAKVNSNTLTSKEIGYDVKAVNNDTNTVENLSEDAQRIVLLSYYASQAQQQFAVQRAGSILNTFKKLNPRFVTFDKLLKNMTDLAKDGENSIFTSESVSKIFEDDQVFKYLFEAMQDLNEQSSKLFLERTSFFAPVKQLFEEVFEDKSTIAKMITSYIALRQYQRLMPGSRTTGVEAIDNLLARDDQNLRDAFKAVYFFTNNLKDEVEQMLQKYPDNKFLQLLVSENGDAAAFTEKGVKITERGLKLVTKANISGSYASDVTDDAYALMIKENLFAKKLFYYELAKTGLMYKSGSFLQLLPTEMMRPFSPYINDFVKALENAKGNRVKLMSAVKSILGNEATEADVYNFFDEVFMLMADAASQEANNNKIRIARQFSFAKDRSFMQSFRFSETATDNERISIASNVLMEFMGQAPKNASKGYTPQNRNAAGEVVSEITLDMSKPALIPEANDDTMFELGKNFGVKRVFGKPGVYKFPLMFKIDSRQESITYLLQGVGEQVEYQNFGESMFRSITGTGASSVEGSIAKYKAIPAVVSTGLMSPIGMSKQEIEKYVAYTTNKAKLPAVAAPAPVATKPATTQPAQVKPGVEELFESNPELANAVYEALGFSKRTNDEIYQRKLSIIFTNEVLRKNQIESTLKDINAENFDFVAFDSRDLKNKQYQVFIDRLLELGYKQDKDGFFTKNGVSAKDLVKYNITPQQKQQAQQLYSQYLDTKQPDVILPIGTSGSGKSTFIKSLPQENLVIIEPDAMRVEFTGDINDKSKDKEIYIEAANRAVQAIKQGKQVVFDTTNITKDKRLPFIEAIKKEIPTANIQYKLMELNPELAKQRIKAQLARSENRAAVSDETIDRHAASYKQMLEDIKSEPTTEYNILGSKQDIEGFKEFVSGEQGAQAPVSVKKENPLITAGVKPTDMSGNAAKDIQMAEESTQYIGFQSGNAAVSSTKKYKEAWGNKANTGNYTETDIVMVSGSGLFRGVTREQIIETLSTKYKSLLNAAIKANASFRVGNQYEKGNLSDQLVAEYLQKNGYTEERLNGYSRWSKATALTSAAQAPQEEMTSMPDATDMLLSMMQATPVEQQTEAVIEPGQFVKFNNETFIVTKINSNSTVQVYNPTLEGPASKKSVSASNLTAIPGSKAVLVDYKGSQYLVTPKNTIISMTTNKAMQWQENNGDRVAVLELASQNRNVTMDMNNLNLTQPVVDYLYNQSSKRLSKESFRQAAAAMIANLRASTPTNQILEKIKCL